MHRPSCPFHVAIVRSPLPLRGIIVAGQIGGLFMLVLAAAQVCDRLRGRSLKLADGVRGHARNGRGDGMHGIVGGMRLVDIDVGGRLWEFALGFDEAGLEVDDVVA